ncbi:PEP-CTERM sorting domain-containing protein [Nitrosospira sp. Nsp14]|uniref:PEP-CTERM sorting domain-containing protein n=1 Tax=Nitrosospira sp. Nsp14 TaxID=1855333 RepID=UPI0035299725
MSLPDSVVALTLARDVNNLGQVAVTGNLIPEPETYVMLLAGLGLLGFIARRRNLLEQRLRLSHNGPDGTGKPSDF